MNDFEFVDGEGLDTAAGYRLIIGCVVPRPIAWITTVDRDGRVNAAPFSSYNYVATSPPMLAINIATRNGEIKDTARNIRESGEFVVNVATEHTMEVMHQTAQEFAPDVSETDALGLELLPSRRVRPPRLAATPVQMECRIDRIVELGRGINTLFIGEVIAFHLSRDDLRRQARRQRRAAPGGAPRRPVLRVARRDPPPADAAAAAGG